MKRQPVVLFVPFLNLVSFLCTLSAIFYNGSLFRFVVWIAVLHADTSAIWFFTAFSLPLISSMWRAPFWVQSNPHSTVHVEGNLTSINYHIPLPYLPRQKVGLLYFHSDHRSWIPYCLSVPVFSILLLGCKDIVLPIYFQTQPALYLRSIGCKNRSNFKANLRKWYQNSWSYFSFDSFCRTIWYINLANSKE